MSRISESLRQQVISRAQNRCEYCQLPSGVSFYAHEVDHVIALKHGGQTAESNLAYACWRCNRYKGSDLGSFDPDTQEFCFLFNPRTQIWEKHFYESLSEIVGYSSEGRTTVKLLKFNTPERIQERQILKQ